MPSFASVSPSWSKGLHSNALAPRGMSPKSWHFLPRRSPVLSPVRISSSTGCSGTGEERGVHCDRGWHSGEAQCTIALDFALYLRDGMHHFEAVRPVVTNRSAA